MTKYKIKVDWIPDVNIAQIIMQDESGFNMVSMSYWDLKEAQKKAQEVAKDLGIDYLFVECRED